MDAPRDPLGGRSVWGRREPARVNLKRGNPGMSVKRLALLVLAAVGAIAATASPAFALSATADTTWMTNGKVFALAQSGNTLYVGGKFAQQVSADGATKIKVKSLGRYDAT